MCFMALDYLSTTLQRYKKFPKPPNISATFFAEKHTLFCIVNNPSLLRDKGMLLRDKGMFIVKMRAFAACFCQKWVEEVDVFS